MVAIHVQTPTTRQCLLRFFVARYGIRGLVMDPYNEIDHRRRSNTSETEYVSQMLTKVKRFAQHYDVHVWLVAHPRQLHNWQPNQCPSLYDISGSAHFVNKCDAGLVVHRNWDTESGGDPRNVGIMVMKMRNKTAGKIGGLDVCILLVTVLLKCIHAWL